MPNRPLKKHLSAESKFQLDYDKLEELMRTRGSIDSVCKAAGTSRQTFYKSRTDLPLPLFDSVRIIIEELDLTLTEFRGLFRLRK